MKKRRITVMIAAEMITAMMMTACSASQTQSPAESQSQTANSSAQQDQSSDDAETADGIISSIVEKLTGESSGSSDKSVKETKNSGSDESYFTERDLSGDYDKESAVTVTCSDSSFTVSGSGAQAKDNVLTISEEGTYIISGTIKDGRIVVDADDSAKVQIVLNGCSITSSDYSAIYVRSADKVFVTLADGTENTISDGKTYASDSEDSNVDAAIFSKSDLVINGSGKLTVNGNMSHAIVSKDDLKITGGTLTITAAGSAVCGKDSVRIANAKIDITGGGDGIKSDNEEDADKGYVYIESGELNITVDNDAVQAQTTLTVLDATINGTTGSGSANSEKSHGDDFGGWGMWGGRNSANNAAASSSSGEDSSSAKGLKAGGDIIADGAKVTIDCADDTIHSGANVTISSGTLALKSGDDGIHAEETMTISGGSVTISESYEGIEAKSIIINDGNVDVTSSDDGLNATDGESEGGMPGGMGQENSNPDVYILITGGTLHVDAGGDGLDSNGTLNIEGGNVTVDGPTNDGNGALDAGSGSTISGGTVIAAGSSGMAETFGSGSSQASILYNFSSSHSAGETITLKDSGGKVIAEYKTTKAFSSVVISTPDISSDGTYTITAGSETAEIKMTSVSYSNGGGMGMGGMRGGMGGGMGGMHGGMDGGMGDMGGMRGGRNEMPGGNTEA